MRFLASTEEQSVTRMKAGLHDHIHIKLLQMFYVITECDRLNGVQKLLEVLRRGEA